MISSVRNSIKNIKSLANNNSKDLISQKINLISFKIFSNMFKNYHDNITSNRISNFSLINKKTLEKQKLNNFFKFNRYDFKYKRNLKMSGDTDNIGNYFYK